MELTAFKNTPEELIRHIMGYARPTYPYLVELKLAKKGLETYYYSIRLIHYINTIIHKKMFMNYRIYGDYVRYYGGEWDSEYYATMCELQEILGRRRRIMDLEKDMNL